MNNDVLFSSFLECTILNTPNARSPKIVGVSKRYVATSTYGYLSLYPMNKAVMSIRPRTSRVTKLMINSLFPLESASVTINPVAFITIANILRSKMNCCF